MIHPELSKALALAIGWPRADIVLGKALVYTGKHDRVKVGGSWMRGYRIFDYRDWGVIGPIATRYDVFPYQNFESKWVGNGFTGAAWPTPQECIARTVVALAKSGDL